MADVKKEQERDELHRAIWAIADELRGSVDGWDFKSYVLGMMFYRYISENLTNYINEGEIEAGNDGFDYVLLSDEDAGLEGAELAVLAGCGQLARHILVQIALHTSLVKIWSKQKDSLFFRLSFSAMSGNRRQVMKT